MRSLLIAKNVATSSNELQVCNMYTPSFVCDSLAESIVLLGTEQVDLVIIDLCCLDNDGIATLKSRHPRINVLAYRMASQDKTAYRYSVARGARPQEDTSDFGKAPSLTPRQMDVLKLLSKGHSTKSIARILNIALGTVKTHTQAIFDELNVNNRTQAANKARELL